MLLRRISKHVKEQNWFAVALDFFIVVVGILIAFQITNWNEQQAENNLERGYLIRLHEDFSRSTEDMIRELSFLQRSIDNQEVVINALKRCRLTDENSRPFQEGVRTLGFINSPPFYRRTINELMSSGRLDIIKNENVLSELADIIQDFEFRDKVTDSVQRRVENYRYKVDAYIFTDLSADAWNLEFDLEDMCADQSVIRAVSSVSFATIERMRAYHRLQQKYEAFLPEIEAELEARWRHTVSVDDEAP